MDPAAPGTGEPPRPKRLRVYLGLSLLMLPILCSTLALRLMDLGDWRIREPTVVLVFVLAFFGAIVTQELSDKVLDLERRMLGVAGFVPAALFLLSFDAPSPIALGLLALAIATLVVGLVLAFLAKRRLRL